MEMHGKALWRCMKLEPWRCIKGTMKKKERKHEDPTSKET
jgi:hypothetical protein